jgi:hypothetical protein
MLNKKLFVPFFALASCTLAFAQQAPTQQVTLESGLQISIGTCTRSSQSITCPVEIANNTQKGVMWNSSAYGDSVRVIDADGTAYIAPVSFGSAASKMTPAGQRNKGSFVISNINSSAAVLPLVQYGSLEFRGVKIGGAVPSSMATSEKSQNKEIAIISDDKSLTAKLIGCAKWKEGFKCDVFLYNNGEKQDRLGFYNSEPAVALTNDGQSFSSYSKMVLDIDNLNASYSTTWLPKTDLYARMYFKTNSIPRKIAALQFSAAVGYASNNTIIFKDIVVK